jgi:hypothetical protein
MAAPVITKHFDLVLCNTPTTGEGTLTVGAAVAPYMNFSQAGVPSGALISYSLIDVAGGNSETGWGVATLTGSTYTLTRNVLASTNSGSPISLSGSATISIDVISQDLLAFAPVASTPQILNDLPVSGGTSFSDTTSITAAYSVYEIDYTIISNNGADSLLMQFYDEGVLNTGSNYNSGWAWFNVHDNSSGVAPFYGSTSIALSNNMDPLASGTIKLFLPAVSGVMKQGLFANVVNQGSPNKLTQMNGSLQYVGSTNPLTGFKLFLAYGTIQAGSTVAVKGVG